MVVFLRACNFGHFLFKIKIRLCFFLFENASSIEIKQETAAVYPGRSPAAGTTISCLWSENNGDREHIRKNVLCV